MDPRWIAVAAVAVGLCGCIPSRLPVRRAEAGLVVDAKTGAPLPGAVVLVESWQVWTPHGERGRKKDVFTTVTDANGRYQIPEKKEWFAVIPIPDLPPAFNRRLCVGKSGYAASVADPWADTKQLPWDYQIPNPIRLQALPAPDSTRSACPFESAD